MLRELEKAFGSYEAWKEQMKQAALTQFGSGWAWLIADAEDGLHIVKTPNQDTPLRGQGAAAAAGGRVGARLLSAIPKPAGGVSGPVVRPHRLAAVESRLKG